MPKDPKKVVALISGGMDSIVMGHLLKEKYNVLPLYISHGQRNIREKDYAAGFARRYCKMSLIDIPIMLDRMVGMKTSLAGSKKMPEANIKTSSDRSATVVPYRNYFFLLTAFAVAHNYNAEYIAIANNRNDRIDYLDCRTDIISGLQVAVYRYCSVSDYKKPELLMPFKDNSKGSVVKLGIVLKVDFTQTLTCYNGKSPACGKCHACHDRLYAFQEAGEKDPLIYESVPNKFKHNIV